MSDADSNETGETIVKAPLARMTTIANDEDPLKREAVLHAVEPADKLHLTDKGFLQIRRMGTIFVRGNETKTSSSSSSAASKDDAKVASDLQLRSEPDRIVWTMRLLKTPQPLRLSLPSRNVLRIEDPAKKEIVLLEFTSRWVLQDLVAQLKKLDDGSSSSSSWALDASFTKRESRDVWVFDYDEGETMIFFDYPLMLGQPPRSRKGYSNLRKIVVGIDEHRAPRFDGKFLQSITRAYERAGFVRYKREQLPCLWSGKYGKHYSKSLGEWRKLRSWQTFNHIPGSTAISHKDVLARAMRRFRDAIASRGDALKRKYIDNFVATPETFVLPTDMDALERTLRADDAKRKWISKPYARSRGEGIEVWDAKGALNDLLPTAKKTFAAIYKEDDASRKTASSSSSDADADPFAIFREDEFATGKVATVKERIQSGVDPHIARLQFYNDSKRNKFEHQKVEDDYRLVVQRYVERPYLVDGLKFDCRMYVVATSFDPLCLWLYDEGLGRFATAPYTESVDDTKNYFAHLTNSSVNKMSDEYAKNKSSSVRDMATGSKRSLRATFEQMESAGVDMTKAMRKIKEAMLRVFVAYEDFLRNACRSISPTFHTDGKGCYELFGVDVIFDRDANPLILELNYSPQIDAPMPMDKLIKGMLMCDICQLVGHRMPPATIDAKDDDDSDDDATVKTVAARDHPKYRKYFKLLAQKILPRPMIERNMAINFLNPKLLDTPDARIKDSASAATKKEEEDVAVPPLPKASDDEVDAQFLRDLSGYVQRKGAHFSSIFPESAAQVTSVAEMFPSAESRKRYAALAEKMRKAGY
eukprot:g1726.t1